MSFHIWPILTDARVCPSFAQSAVNKQFKTHRKIVHVSSQDNRCYLDSWALWMSFHLIEAPLTSQSHRATDDLSMAAQLKEFVKLSCEKHPDMLIPGRTVDTTISLRELVKGEGAGDKFYLGMGEDYTIKTQDLATDK